MIETTGRLVFAFEEGSAADRARLGGKGAGLSEMTRIGLRVPPGFTITTDACRAYFQTGREPAGLRDEVARELARLEARMGRRLGDASDPLLLSVRSGAPISMPGMMDTILNLGLTRQTVEGLAARTGDRRFAFDSLRRLLQMFGNVVLGIPLDRFEAVLGRARRAAGAAEDAALDAAALEAVADEYREVIRREAGRPFPEDAHEQLTQAIEAVFKSWNNPRAQVYRQLHAIPDTMGTAVNVQAMVFGNRGPGSGTGVLFTRDPNTGANELTGEYLENAQGEDVVAGIRTPTPVSVMRDRWPELYAELERGARVLEDHYRDVQDIEFTIESGTLYFLQTRSAKRSAPAALRILVEMVHDGSLSREEAVRRMAPSDLEQLFHPELDPSADLEELGRGLAASPGAATGCVTFDPDRAQALARSGQKVILVRPETAPDDVAGIIASEGVVTSRGGMTCHAAIVARGMGKPCVVGLEALSIDLGARRATIGARTLTEGDVISVDGATGRVYLGEAPLVAPDLGDRLPELLGWADAVRRLGVRANADTPADAERSAGFGAEGIGLCRTEHMFMAPERLPVVHEMILAETAQERQAALDRLLPMQQADFEGILRAMDGRPVTIRLLDPPLHEFLPDVQGLAVEVAVAEARGEGNTAETRRRRDLLRRARAMAEKNPMLGFRGCRLGVIYPDIYRMQVRAIVRAAAAVVASGGRPHPEVMIPLVGEPEELRRLRLDAEQTWREECARAGVTLPVSVGTMIEVPRACVLADKIAAHADFFSFGTNDLTQTTFGMSRDDAEGKFLGAYVSQGILGANPFEELDREGVGRLIAMAVEGARASGRRITLGICGEHGGNPASIRFCHEVGLDYVSASPFRVPVARLAAAQAALAAQDSGQD
jgi:pyruvate,orthophosphate dikinase